MKLFEMKNWELTVREEAWGLAPFAKILKRDKTKDKSKALKDMMFIWHYCDVKSDFDYITNDEERASIIKKELNLPASWKLDATIKDGIRCYEQLSTTVSQTLYRQSRKSVAAIGEYLENTEALLKERDNNGKPIYDIGKITSANEKVPKLIANLKAAYKELIKEQEDMDNRTKGSRKMNMFEEGLDF